MAKNLHLKYGSGRTVAKPVKMDELVMRVMGEAARIAMTRAKEEDMTTGRRKRRSAAGDLLAMIRTVQPVAQKESAVRAWLNGENVPNADIFLAATTAAGIRLDALLYEESVLGKLDRLEQIEARSQARLEELEETLGDFQGRLAELIAKSRK